MNRQHILILSHTHGVKVSVSLYKSVCDWLKMLPLAITTLDIQEDFLLDTKEMKRNDLWLNVKGDYHIFFIGKILLN